jgi:hypothetical protein
MFKFSEAEWEPGSRSFGSRKMFPLHIHRATMLNMYSQNLGLVILPTFFCYYSPINSGNAICRKYDYG